MARLERHAIVMGASMSGLLAARALADHYSSVTVIERDEFPAECQPRKACRKDGTSTGFSPRAVKFLNGCSRASPTS